MAPSIEHGKWRAGDWSRHVGVGGSFVSIEREVRIRDPGITVGQLLKLAGLIDSGAEAKAFLQTEQVSVNGEPEARRGRKLSLDDVVRVGELELRLTSADSDIHRPDHG